MPTTTAAIYSCDDHLDLSAVPPDLWESRLSGAEAERGPRVVARERGSMWLCEGRVMGRSGMPADRAAVKGYSAIGRAGIDDDGSESRRAIDETLGSLTEAERRKITATNCARLYGFPDVS